MVPVEACHLVETNTRPARDVDSLSTVLTLYQYLVLEVRKYKVPGTVNCRRSLSLEKAESQCINKSINQQLIHYNLVLTSYLLVLSFTCLFLHFGIN